MAARRRGIGSRGGAAPNRPDLKSRIWAMAQIVPGAVNDSVRQTILPAPPAYHNDRGRQTTVRGFHVGWDPRNEVHKSKSPSPCSGSTEGIQTWGLEPGSRAGMGQS